MSEYTKLYLLLGLAIAGIVIGLILEIRMVIELTEMKALDELYSLEELRELDKDDYENF